MSKLGEKGKEERASLNTDRVGRRRGKARTARWVLKKAQRPRSSRTWDRRAGGRSEYSSKKSCTADKTPCDQCGVRGEGEGKSGPLGLKKGAAAPVKPDLG